MTLFMSDPNPQIRQIEAALSRVGCQVRVRSSGIKKCHANIESSCDVLQMQETFDILLPNRMELSAHFELPSRTFIQHH